MLFAYLDESGLNPTAKATVVAGLIGPVTNWIPFEGRWRARLAASGLGMFHTQPCQRGTKEYKRLSEPARFALYNDLADIVASCDLRPVSGSVLLDGWQTARTDNAFRERYPTAYSFAFELCLTDIQIIARAAKMKVQVFYGFSSAYAKRAELVAQAYTASQRYARWIKGCDVKKPKDVSPLQAADMLCYEVYHQWQSVPSGKGPLQRLIPRLNPGVCGIYYDREGIEKANRNGPLGFID